jgi:hypothetical protein
MNPITRVLRRAHAVSLFCACLTMSAPLLAQEGADLDAFEVGKLQDQMELDITPVPVGMGALFVPSMTDPALEPVITVLSNGSRVASGKPGKRIVLPPGQYIVRFGSGEATSRPERSISVIEGVTTPVEPFFGAVRITAVDTDGRPVSVPYVIESLDGKISFGPSKTAEDGGYTSTKTMIVPAGRYNIALGKTIDTESNRFATVVAEGQVLRYRLVVDDDQLSRVEFAQREVVAEPSIWRFRWVLGGDFGFERTENNLAAFNGDALRVGAFMDSTIGLDTGNHLALTNIRLDETWLALESQVGQRLPLQKINDELSLEVLYNYRLGGIIGPYVRASGSTAFFDTYLYPDQAITVTTSDRDGSDVTVRTVDAGDELRLFQGFAPMLIQEDAGIGLTFVDNDVITFIVRGGVGARQSTYRGGGFVTNSSGQEVAIERLEDKQDFGAAASAVFGLRLGGVFSLDSRFTSFMPQEQVFQEEDFGPVYRFDNTAALSLGKFAALVYDITLRRDDVQIDEMQMRQNISLRLQYTLF